MTNAIPLSLYIHLPWCVKKCPYCDFNSHEIRGNLPEEAYVSALLDELDHVMDYACNRPIVSIFFGGGTPSLFSGNAIGAILAGVNQRLQLDPGVEITLEANPGTVDQARFHDFYAAGINRLSLGIQSFQADKLKALGRIHNPQQAENAIKAAKSAGFQNFNLDLMYGLPEQTCDEAIADLEKAIAFAPTHLSWYQLTIEPNTAFYRQPPALPQEDESWEMQLAGQTYLHQAGFTQYEVSAYSQAHRQCRHNLNYWEFGDYLGLGAGAHSKITHEGEIIRFSQVKPPNHYLDKQKRLALSKRKIGTEDSIFEFMLNALRLTHGFPLTLFSERTGLPIQHIHPLLQKTIDQKLIDINQQHLQLTTLGHRYLNNVVGLFLPN